MLTDISELCSLIPVCPGTLSDSLLTLQIFPWFFFCLRYSHRTWCSAQSAAPVTDIAAQAAGYSKCQGASAGAGKESPGSCHIVSSSQTQLTSIKAPAVSRYPASVGANGSTQHLLLLFVPSKGQDSSPSLSSVLGCWGFFVILAMKCKTWALLLV